MMKELREMSQKMNALNAKIKALKDEREMYITKKRDVLTKCNERTELSHITSQINSINSRLEYKTTKNKLMFNHYQEILKHIASNIVLSHLEANNGKKWTKRNADKISTDFKKSIPNDIVNISTRPSDYNPTNLEISLTTYNHVLGYEKSYIVLCDALNENKYIQAENITIHTLKELNHDINFDDLTADILNTQNKIAQLKEQIKEMENTIPYCLR